ncbi:MAG: CBS domain-containing protein [Candidatus Bilamarchaeaceae archaeon]
MDKPLITEREIRSILEIGVEEKAIEASENELINHLLDFRDTPVRTAMVPIKHAIMLNSGLSVEEAKRIAVEKGFSKYPVLSRDNGRISGVVHTKHLDRLIKEGKSRLLLEKVMASSVPILISEKESLDVLFRKMQREHIHMAVVVDENGNQTWIISFEDLIEEIFGEIADEEEKKRGRV